MNYFRSPLIKNAADKARNCLAIGLYDELFRQIMLYINMRFSPSSRAHSINVLDIAGFGNYSTIIY